MTRSRSRARTEEIHLQLPRLCSSVRVSSVTLTHDFSHRSPSESSPSHSTSTSNGRPRRPSSLRTALMPRTAHRPCETRNANGDPRRAVDSNSRDKAASRGHKFQHREYAPCAFVCRRYFEYFLGRSVTKPLPVSRLPPVSSYYYCLFTGSGSRVSRVCPGSPRCLFTGSGPKVACRL